MVNLFSPLSLRASSQSLLYSGDVSTSPTYSLHRWEIREDCLLQDLLVHDNRAKGQRSRSIPAWKVHEGYILYLYVGHDFTCWSVNSDGVTLRTGELKTHSIEDGPFGYKRSLVVEEKTVTEKKGQALSVYS